MDTARVTERWLGRRFFRRLSDAELIAWRPADGRFHEGNFSACNREVRRRAKKAGAVPYVWIVATSILQSREV